MKKWSYATALMLSLAGGGMLTGCIDNDEPYGIKEIRLATASLLESKKAAAEAEAAATAAQAEINKIKAETERINAEKEKILAEAQAEILKAQAAHEQAKADSIKAETEAYLAAEQAKLDEYIAKAEISIKEAQLAYDKLVYEWERTKVANATADNDILYASVRSYYDAYIWNLQNFNNLNEEYLMAQHKAAKWANDLVWEKGEWVSPQYNLKETFENAVAAKEKEIAEKNALIKECTDFNDKLASIKASDLGKLLDEYKAKLQANTEVLADAKIESEEIVLNNKPLRDEIASLKTQKEDLQKKDIVIPEYEIPAQSNIPFFQSVTPVIPKDWKYTLNDLENEDNLYVDAESRYNNVITTLELAMMDENDKAWTQASINTMERQLEAANVEYGKDVQEWQLAKTVYNNGKAADASVLPMAAEIDKAIAEYEAEGASIADLRQKKIDAGKAQEEALKDFNNALNTYKKEPSSVVNTWNNAVLAYNNALKQSWSDYNKAIEDADKAEDEAISNAEKEQDSKYAALEIAEKNLTAANLELAEKPADKTLQENKKKAQEAYDLALKNVTGSAEAYAKVLETSQKAKQSAYNLARATRLKAEASAQTNYETAKKAFYAAGGYDEEKDPAYAPVKEASETYEKAQEAYQAATDALEDANPWKIYDKYEAIANVIEAQEEEIGFDWELSEFTMAYNGIENYINGAEELPKLIAPALYQYNQVYYNAKNYLVNKSIVAYGSLGVDYDDTKEYGFYEPDEAFLVDNVTKDMVDAYIHAMSPDTQSYSYYRFYPLFSLYGKILELEYKIGMAKATLTNASSITAVLDVLNENLDSLKASKENALAEVDTVDKTLKAKEAEYKKLFTDINATIRELYGIEGNLKRIIALINEGIAKVNFPDKNGDYNAITEMISNNTISLNNYKKDLEGLNKELELAQYQLDQFNSGKADYNINPFEIEVNSLKAKVEAAQAELDFIKEALDATQARYEELIKK